ncbi:YitT family protein [Sporosalibacterium faouarense]|uniref:YitT family protein n=1 Tax=Sporosalibacterium faouarense TaxID=516123 RepID=UPI00192AA3CC|nr:YitT family protein [Sporosalibacterium faouarense]
MIKNSIKTDYFLRIFLILLGSMIIAIGINLFIVPNKLLAAGFSGISIILQYLTGISSGIYLLLLNIPVFFMAMKKIDREFAIVSLIGMLSLSLFLVITRPLSGVIEIKDTLVAAVYGGLFNGIGAGIIFRSRGSTGGTDIISIIFKKQFEISVSSVFFLINGIIILINATIDSYVLAVYTLISIYIATFIMNKILVGLDKKKLLLIVTEKEDDVSRAIMENTRRGVTFLDGVGGYTKKRRKIIYCVVSSRQLAQVKKILIDVDKKSFMSIIDTSEIHGAGFKKPVF